MEDSVRGQLSTSDITKSVLKKSENIVLNESRANKENEVGSSLTSINQQPQKIDDEKQLRQVKVEHKKKKEKRHKHKHKERKEDKTDVKKYNMTGNLSANKEHKKKSKYLENKPTDQTQQQRDKKIPEQKKRRIDTESKALQEEDNFANELSIAMKSDPFTLRPLLVSVPNWEKKQEQLQAEKDISNVIQTNKYITSSEKKTQNELHKEKKEIEHKIIEEVAIPKQIPNFECSNTNKAINSPLKNKLKSVKKENKKIEELVIPQQVPNIEGNDTKKDFELPKKDKLKSIKKGNKKTKKKKLSKKIREEMLLEIKEVKEKYRNRQNEYKDKKKEKKERKKREKQHEESLKSNKLDCPTLQLQENQDEERETQNTASYLETDSINLMSLDSTNEEQTQKNDKKESEIKYHVKKLKYYNCTNDLILPVQQQNNSEKIETNETELSSHTILKSVEYPIPFKFNNSDKYFNIEEDPQTTTTLEKAILDERNEDISVLDSDVTPEEEPKEVAVSKRIAGINPSNTEKIIMKDELADNEMDLKSNKGKNKTEKKSKHKEKKNKDELAKVEVSCVQKDNKEMKNQKSGSSKKHKEREKQFEKKSEKHKIYPTNNKSIKKENENEVVDESHVSQHTSKKNNTGKKSKNNKKATKFCIPGSTTDDITIAQKETYTNRNPLQQALEPKTIIVDNLKPDEDNHEEKSLCQLEDQYAALIKNINELDQNDQWMETEFHTSKTENEVNEKLNIDIKSKKNKKQKSEKKKQKQQSTEQKEDDLETIPQELNQRLAAILKELKELEELEENDELEPLTEEMKIDDTSMKEQNQTSDDITRDVQGFDTDVSPVAQNEKQNVTDSIISLENYNYEEKCPQQDDMKKMLKIEKSQTSDREMKRIKTTNHNNELIQKSSEKQKLSKEVSLKKDKDRLSKKKEMKRLQKHTEKENEKAKAKIREKKQESKKDKKKSRKKKTEVEGKHCHPKTEKLLTDKKIKSSNKKNVEQMIPEHQVAEQQPPNINDIYMTEIEEPKPFKEEKHSGERKSNDLSLLSDLNLKSDKKQTFDETNKHTQNPHTGLIPVAYEEIQEDKSLQQNTNIHKVDGNKITLLESQQYDTPIAQDFDRDHVNLKLPHEHVFQKKIKKMKYSTKNKDFTAKANNEQQLLINQKHSEKDRKNKNHDINVNYLKSDTQHHIDDLKENYIYTNESRKENQEEDKSLQQNTKIASLETQYDAQKSSIVQEFDRKHVNFKRPYEHVLQEKVKKIKYNTMMEDSPEKANNQEQRLINQKQNEEDWKNKNKNDENYLMGDDQQQILQYNCDDLNSADNNIEKETFQQQLGIKAESKKQYLTEQKKITESPNPIQHEANQIKSTSSQSCEKNVVSRDAPKVFHGAQEKVCTKFYYQNEPQAKVSQKQEALNMYQDRRSNIQKSRDAYKVFHGAQEKVNRKLNYQNQPQAEVSQKQVALNMYEDRRSNIQKSRDAYKVFKGTQDVDTKLNYQKGPGAAVSQKQADQKLTEERRLKIQKTRLEYNLFWTKAGTEESDSNVKPIIPQQENNKHAPNIRNFVGKSENNREKLSSEKKIISQPYEGKKATCDTSRTYQYVMPNAQKSSIRSIKAASRKPSSDMRTININNDFTAKSSIMKSFPAAAETNQIEVHRDKKNVKKIISKLKPFENQNLPSMPCFDGTAEVKPNAGEEMDAILKKRIASRGKLCQKHPRDATCSEASEIQAHLSEEDDVDMEEIAVSDTYETYWPSKRTDRQGREQNSAKHPNEVLEVSTLCSTKLPDITYKLEVANLIKIMNPLSDLQIEAMIHASQTHEHFLPSGHRAGFLLGDGAGVGKGRTIAAIICENFRLGLSRVLWVSVSGNLKLDVERDLQHIGARKYVKVSNLNKFEYTHIGFNVIESECFKNGIICCTYSDLLGESTNASGMYKTRVDQLVQWLGQIGVIVLDECHKAIRLSSTNGDKFIKTCTTVLRLQQLLPQTRVIYASATAASEPSNMVFMSRLGLWGMGTVYPQFHEFVNAVEQRGNGTMDLVAIDMKLRGIYVARQLSYRNVKFRIEMVPMSREFHKFYNYSTDLWSQLNEQVLKASRRLCLKEYVQEQISSQFWYAHRRYFKHLCLAYKLKQVVKLANEATLAEKAVVIGIEATGECKTHDYLEHYQGKLTCFVSTAMTIIQSFIEHYFPAPSSEYFHKLVAKHAFNRGRKKSSKPPASKLPRIDSDCSDDFDDDVYDDECNDTNDNDNGDDNNRENRKYYISVLNL